MFQHLKMAFWAYLLTNKIEYFIRSKKVDKASSFWYARLFSTVTVPWFILLIWYVVPALYGKIDSLALDRFICWPLTIQFWKKSLKGKR